MLSDELGKSVDEEENKRITEAFPADQLTYIDLQIVLFGNLRNDACFFFFIGEGKSQHTCDRRVNSR